MPSCSLNIIDLAKAAGPLRGEVAQDLYQALTTSGFFYLKGIKNYQEDELMELASWFFSLPESVKLSISKKKFNPKSSQLYRGFFPVQDGEISHKEGFEMGSGETAPIDSKNQYEKILVEGNIWPQTKHLTINGSNFDHIFKEKMERYYELLTETGREVIKLIAEGSGLSPDFFEDLFYPSHLSTLRLLHYPARKGEVPDIAKDGDTVLLCDEHQDSTFLTLLNTFGYGGLQIRGEHGEWVDVPKLEGCLVVNIGVTLSTISGGKFKATNHRVVDTGGDRFSVPYFVEPGFHADISIRMPSRSTAAQKPSDQENGQADEHLTEKKSPVFYGPWLIERMSKLYAEFRNLSAE